MQTTLDTTSVPDRQPGAAQQGLTARWELRNPVTPDPALTPSHTPAPADPAPQSTAQFSALLTRILDSRHISDSASIAAYLKPSLLDMHDPSLLPNCDAAARRILDAVAHNEKIVIYGDYDVDGVTASTILWHTIKTLAPHADLRCYVPHRLDEGYGLNTQALEMLANEGADLIVSVDCGITAKNEAARARALGVDLIITDHHNMPESPDDLPDAFALVHPRLPGSEYPFGQLCGAGVAYKLAWRVLTMAQGNAQVSKPMQNLLIELLAFAALGSIADVVPLVGENRIITRFGLARIKNSPFAGLRALLEASNLDKKDIDAERVAFILAPRLNACGRLGHAHEVVRMLTEASFEEAFAIADELNSQNAKRRALEHTIVEEAIELAQSAGMDSPERRAIVLASPDWHKGVVGIACSRLVERYCRPVILMHDDQETGLCAGSGRSVKGVSIHAALAQCDHLLESWGGHDMAAGMSCTRDNLEAFTHAFTDAINAMLEPTQLVRTILYDCDVTLDELDLESVAALARFGPFGAGNPGVKLRACDLTIAEKPRQVGKNGLHLSLRVKASQEGKPGEHWLKLIAWRFGPHASKLARGMRIDALLTPSISTWSGSETVEATLHDLRIHRSD